MSTTSPIQVPAGGQKIVPGEPVPDNPIIPFIEGDGIGVDITPVMKDVVDAAVAKAYDGAREIHWMEIYAGEKSTRVYGPDEWLPQETLEVVREYAVAIKGPMTTPVGGGIRSLNVALRQELDLYVCLRPVRYFAGVPSPLKDPSKVDMVIFRENTEDIYAGVEWPAESDGARKLIAFLQDELGVTKIRFPETSGIGIKPISREGTQRLVRRALRYAVEHDRRSVTLVHKGNIMKFTEGAFRDWGYEVAREKFPEDTTTEAELTKAGPTARADAVVMRDRIADSMFQQLLLRPSEYSVIATPNLNGDYLSDAAAAQVGGLGIAPGGNVGDGVAVFEATHGTAPKYANLDKINPGSVILSGAMMFEYLGWHEAEALVIKGVESAIRSKRVTYDLARQMPGATEVSTSAFGDQVIAGMKN